MAAAYSVLRPCQVVGELVMRLGRSEGRQRKELHGFVVQCGYGRMDGIFVEGSRMRLGAREPYSGDRARRCPRVVKCVLETGAPAMSHA